MLEYRDRIVQEAAACTCDRCRKGMTSDDHDSGWHERMSLSFRGGFDSIFGDGNKVSIDLCQQCVRDTLGAWLRITPPEPDGLAYQERLRSEWDGHAADRWRPPRGAGGNDA
ncbi:hypothetical protein [Paraburkholderia caledonica]|uniref:hypothetical protein n=1 Tax=Paraburkholderia caledonica TaxID=134536 RepID=UPI0038B73B11